MKAKTEIFQKKKEERKLGLVTWFMHYKDLIFFFIGFCFVCTFKVLYNVDYQKFSKKNCPWASNDIIKFL